MHGFLMSAACKERYSSGPSDVPFAEKSQLVGECELISLPNVRALLALYMFFL